MYNDEEKEDHIGRAYSMNEEKINAYRTVVGKPEGKRTAVVCTQANNNEQGTQKIKGRKGMNN
jgi:hypothetical protein